MGVKQIVKMNYYGKKRYVWEKRDATNHCDERCC